MLVLGTRNGVQVEDRVYAMASTGIHNTVEEPEALLADLERCVIVLEVPVVERDPHGVQAEALEESGVLVREEGCHEPVEESVAALVAEHATQRAALLRFGSGVAGDEVLHVHPAAEPETAKGDRRRTRDDARAVHVERGWLCHVILCASVSAVHDTGGRVTVTVPSARRAVSLGRRRTRS